MRWGVVALCVGLSVVVRGVWAMGAHRGVVALWVWALGGDAIGERRGDNCALVPPPDRVGFVSPLPGPLAPVRHEPGVAAHPDSFAHPGLSEPS